MSDPPPTCRICRLPSANHTAEHRTVHIEHRPNGLSLAFTDGSGMGIRKDNPYLTESVGWWFLNEIDALPPEQDQPGSPFEDAARAIEAWEADPPSKWSCPCGFTGGGRNIRQHRLQCFAWSCYVAWSRRRAEQSRNP